MSTILGTPQDSTTSEEKGGRGYWGFVVWPVVAVVLYLLSTGPVLLLAHKRLVSRGLLVVYEPVLIASDWHVVGKPICLYFHLWIPDVIDIHGKGVAPF